jgi:hypothetical protein
VLVRFVWTGERIVSLAVVDDGRGMGDDELRNAMRFGSDARFDASSLGKFGMGLKLASFSHARLVTVVSRKDGKHHGRRWSLEGIRRNWDCEILDAAQAAALYDAPWSPLRRSANGTVVLWEGLDKLPTASTGLRATLRALQRRLEVHLGLHFHRFLESGRLRILLDQQESGEPEHQIRVEIAPLNPFSYSGSPVEGFPRWYTLDVAGVGALDVEAHIWPPNSDEPEYRLGNRAAGRQGFYFYRNDRLIQAGGWNGLVQNDSEPHGSLARIRVDLPPEYDASFSLNVQKSSVIVPPGFVEAAQGALSRCGDTLDSYRAAAQQVYRRRDRRAAAGRPLALGPGVPARLRKATLGGSAEEASDLRPVSFRWVELDESELFGIDRDRDAILLNERYRDDVLAGLRPESGDVPLLKTLLFALLEGDLRRSRVAAKRRSELARINRLLVAAARFGLG